MIYVSRGKFGDPSCVGGGRWLDPKIFDFESDVNTTKLLLAASHGCL